MLVTTDLLYVTLCNLGTPGKKCRIFKKVGHVGRLPAQSLDQSSASSRFSSDSSLAFASSHWAVALSSSSLPPPPQATTSKAATAVAPKRPRFTYLRCAPMCSMLVSRFVRFQGTSPPAVAWQTRSTCQPRGVHSVLLEPLGHKWKHALKGGRDWEPVTLVHTAQVQLRFLAHRGQCPGS